VTHDRLLEQLAEEYNNRPLQTAVRRCSVTGSDVIGHLLLLLLWVTSIGVDDLPQSYLPQRSDEQLFHPVIQ